MATSEDIFQSIDDIDPIAAMWIALRGKMKSEMPTDIADECVKATARMFAAHQEVAVENIRMANLSIHARIMGIDISNISKEN